MNLVDHSQALVAFLVVCAVALIVAYDILHLIGNKRTVPLLGELDNGGYAWASTLVEESARNSPNLLTVVAMMLLPWLLAMPSDTPEWTLVVFDVLLLLLMVTMVLPKRYAITSTHLYADGQRSEWANLQPLDAEKPIRGRIVLQRRGWWLFAPLPLGGSAEELRRARELILEWQYYESATDDESE